MDYLQIPTPKVITGVHITARDLLVDNSGSWDERNAAPKDFKILGSNDGINWDEVLSVTGANIQDITNGGGSKFDVHTTNVAYNRFALVVQAVNGGVYLAVSEIRYITENFDKNLGMLSTNSITTPDSSYVSTVLPGSKVESIPMDMELGYSNDWTIEWEHMDTATSSFNQYVANGDGGRMNVRVNSDGTYRVSLAENEDRVDLPSENITDYVPNQKNKVRFVFNGSSGTYYYIINGVTQSEHEASSWPTVTMSHINYNTNSINASAGQPAHPTNTMYAFRYWNRVYTENSSNLSATDPGEYLKIDLGTPIVAKAIRLKSVTEYKEPVISMTDYNQGGYEVTVSSEATSGAQPGYLAFNNLTTPIADRWIAGKPKYDVVSGSYVASARLSTDYPGTTGNSKPEIWNCADLPANFGFHKRHGNYTIFIGRITHLIMM